MTQLINSFRGEFFFLSNFFPVVIWNGGIRYLSMEHAFQAAKTLDMAERRMIAELPTPGQAKRTGRKVTLRPDWEQVKLAMMERIVRRKFSIPSLAQRLIATFPAKIVEGNTWGDRYWGVCAGVGANHLGEILMKIRKELMEAVH
uniref:NADAR domain-containing protein n=1 Tax=viral metagenome TaxID=1070528 RepID=A0A6M3KX68_9ZZZZ